MANHCYNWITITGDSDSIQKLIDKCEQPEVQDKTLFYSTYHILFPDTNKRYPGADEDDDFDVYEEYGSKWFDLGIDYPEDKEYVNIMGDSAWSPMEALCEKLSHAYGLKIHIEYEESGLDFGGFTEFENGIEIDSGDWTYRGFQYQNDASCFMDNVEEDIWEDIWEDLKEFKTDCEEVWSMMTKEHKSEIKSIFEERANKIKLEENGK